MLLTANRKYFNVYLYTNTRFETLGEEVRVNSLEQDTFDAIEKPDSLRREVYERIKSAIVGRRLNPGERLDEKTLSESLGVSRTPVREALSRLDHEGLVYSCARRGVFVQRFTIKDVLEIIEMREVLEGLATRLFTQRASELERKKLRAIVEPYTTANVGDLIDEYNRDNVRFHDLIMLGSGNSRLVQSLRNLYDHYAMATTVRIIALTKRGGRSVDEHHAIVEAILARDAPLAEQLMRTHIRAVADDVRDNLVEIEASVRRAYEG